MLPGTLVKALALTLRVPPRAPLPLFAFALNANKGATTVLRRKPRKNYTPPYGTLAIITFASRAIATVMRCTSITALLRPPCFHAPLAGPVGAPPPAPCIRQTFQPTTAGALHRLPVALALAWHLGAPCALCMGLASLSIITPPPMCHGPDNRLSARVHGHMLHCHFLPPASAVAFEGFHLHRVSPGQFV